MTRAGVKAKRTGGGCWAGGCAAMLKGSKERDKNSDVDVGIDGCARSDKKEMIGCARRNKKEIRR